MANVYFTHAMREGIAEAMREDPTVFVFGEDVDRSVLGPPRAWSRSSAGPGAQHPDLRAGRGRPPCGAAASGLRPVLDLMFGGFFYVAMDQVINQIAHLRYMSGGQARTCRIVLMAGDRPGRPGRGPALREPARRADVGRRAEGRRALDAGGRQGPDGVRHRATRTPSSTSWTSPWPAPGGRCRRDDHVVPLGSADVQRPGPDVTVVAMASAVPAAIARRRSAGDRGHRGRGDRPPIAGPAGPGHRSSVRWNAPGTSWWPRRGVGPVAWPPRSARRRRAGLGLPRAPPVSVTWPDVPVPYTPTLEMACVVGTEDIVDGVRRVMQLSSARV